jgi:hypothetical protein
MRHISLSFGTRLARVPVRPVAVLAAAGLVVLAACGSSGRPAVGASSRSARVQTLRIALDYTANVDYLGIYVAITNGYFAAAGIKADIIPYSGAAAARPISASPIHPTSPPTAPAVSTTKPSPG